MALPNQQTRGFTGEGPCSEDEMHSVDGRVSKLLYDSMGFLHGFVLGRGQEVRFWVSHANVGAVTAILTIGSRVEAQGDLRSDGGAEQYLQAALITNLDSRRTASLPAPVCLGKPGMPSDGAPTTVASLAHFRIVDAQRPSGTVSQAEEDAETVDLYIKQITEPQPSASSSDEHASEHNGSLHPATGNDAAADMECAYDGLHRIQAILAYLNIVKRHVPGISQFLDEAKHTYEQALARYQTQDFEGTREFAAASRCLSRVVEIVISRTLRSDTSYPSLVPRPPEHLTSGDESSRVQDDLKDVQAVLSRLHWLMENGTLPLEDRTQVRKIASWGDALYQQTVRMYRSGAMEDASDLVQAANSAAQGAEHICRNWYIAHTQGCRTTASQPSS